MRTGDNMAAALGLACLDVAVLSLGTPARPTPCDHPTSDPSGAVAGFADASGSFLPWHAPSSDQGDRCNRDCWVRSRQFDRLALSAPRAGGLTLLPYFDGERTPNLPKSTGLVAGLRSDVSREQIARAAVEGVVCGLLDALDALSAQAPIEAVRLVGGGARSAAYRQVVADLCQLPVMLADADEAVATGACVQAAAVARGTAHREVAEQWGLGSTLDPRQATPQGVASLRRAAIDHVSSTA
jgi:xylulokinase